MDPAAESLGRGFRRRFPRLPPRTAPGPWPEGQGRGPQRRARALTGRAPEPLAPQPPARALRGPAESSGSGRRLQCAGASASLPQSAGPGLPRAGRRRPGPPRPARPAPRSAGSAPHAPTPHRPARRSAAPPSPPSLGVARADDGASGPPGPAELVLRQLGVWPCPSSARRGRSSVAITGWGGVGWRWGGVPIGYLPRSRERPLERTVPRGQSRPGPSLSGTGCPPL